MFRSSVEIDSSAPITAWFGGVLGVAFVALNSHVLPKLGASKTTSFVVGAQMLASVAIDSLGCPFSEATLAVLAGSAIVMTGVWMAAFAKTK